MKVTISLFGRFHGFYLAHQLYKKNYLNQLITSYPKYEVEKYGIPPKLVHSLLGYEVFDRLWRKLPKGLTSQIDIRHVFNSSFSQSAAKKISPDIDIFVGWSGKSEPGLKMAKSLGALTILERGSSHPEFHRDILIEEYEKYGLFKEIEFERNNYQPSAEYEIADYISVPSEFVKRTFIEKGVSPEKLIKVNYGVDLSQFKQLDKTDNVFRVIFVGGMSLRKGVHYLLQAFAELNLPNSELWLIGSHKPEIDPFFQKYEGHFRYFGHIPQAELHKYYSQCSVFTMCSIEEGLALVQAQAMACGLPLICTTNTGGEDLIESGKSGFVIPIRSVDAIKQKLVWCYENQAVCKDMGQLAKQSALNRYSWNDYGDRVISAYKKCLKSFSEKPIEG